MALEILGYFFFAAYPIEFYAKGQRNGDTSSAPLQCIIV